MQWRLRAIMLLVLSLALVAAACGDDDDAGTTTAAPTTTQAETETTQATETTAAAEPTTTAAPAPDAPTDLNVGIIVLGVKEEPWYSTLLDSIDRTAAAAPYGLNITHEEFEGIAYADGERVIRDLAQTGEYEMIIAHSTYSDAVAAVAPDFPDMLFAFSGSGNEAVGGNGYWIDVFIHEPAYLAGIVAGMMTETNQISAVAAFPFPNVNAPLNAYIDGAKSVNPDVTAEVTYIESWFDPATAKESATAQISAGSDMVYAERFGPFEAALESDSTFAFGHFADQIDLAPEVVLTSPVALWDPAFNVLVDEWWAHVVDGAAYDAPLERIMFLMKDGGSDIGTVSDLVPAEVAAAMEEARAQILSGELEIPINDGPIE